MSAPALQRVAAWDVPAARGALAALTALDGGWPDWRRRVDEAGRQLTAPGCWSGPAAAAGAAAVAELSAAAVAVGADASGCLASLRQAVTRASGAQELASRALALAAGAGVALDPDGTLAAPVPLPTPATAPDQAAALAEVHRTAAAATSLAAEALDEAALASAAATAAGDALRPLAPAGAAPAGFGDLVSPLALDGPVCVPAPPAGRAPAAVAAWWAGLPLGTRLAALERAPEVVGGLDGVPAWARDRANRELLHRALAAGPDRAAATTVAGLLAAEDATDATVQLQLLDLRGGRVAVALGDLDTAADVAVLVPGMGNAVLDGGLAHLTSDARLVSAAARAAAPAAAVATVAWLGYRTPGDLPAAGLPLDAWTGGRQLDDALDGLAAARSAAGAPRSRTTVVAHSYGTLVAGMAARRPGRLAADAVALLGSPGTGVGGARGLEAPEVYAAGSPLDPISHLQYYGTAPTAPWYRATLLPVEPWTGHGGYYDPGHPTLAALGRVVVGTERHR